MLSEMIGFALDARMLAAPADVMPTHRSPIVLVSGNLAKGGFSSDKTEAAEEAKP